MIYKITVETKIYGERETYTNGKEYREFYFSRARKLYVDLIKQYLEKYSQHEISSCTIQLVEFNDTAYNILYLWKI